MKLSIVVDDGTVVIDGYGFSNLLLLGIPTDVHAVQWQETRGWIEHNDGKLNKEITSFSDLPPWVNLAIDAWQTLNDSILQEPEQSNKDKAITLLYQTDWVEMPSVSDINRIPHLLNLEDFLKYRENLRKIVLSLDSLNNQIEWPILPSANWSSL